MSDYTIIKQNDVTKILTVSATPIATASVGLQGPEGIQGIQGIQGLPGLVQGISVASANGFAGTVGGTAANPVITLSCPGPLTTSALSATSGNFSSAVTLTNNDARLYLKGGAATNGFLLESGTDKSVSVWNYENTSMYLGTNNTTRLSIAGSGAFDFKGNTVTNIGSLTTTGTFNGSTAYLTQLFLTNGGTSARYSTNTNGEINFNYNNGSTGSLSFYGGSTAPVFQVTNTGATSILSTAASTSTTTGALTVAGGIGVNGQVNAISYQSNQTVDQETVYGVNSTQTSPTLQNEVNSGVDEAFNNTYEAIKFTATGNHTIRSFGVRIKVSVTLTNPTGVIYGRLYTDNAGQPGTLIAGSIYTRYGSLTTSYLTYQFYSSATLVSGNSYWLVLQQNIAPAGGTISYDTVASGTGRSAYSADGTTWTVEDGKTGWFILYGRTPIAVYGTSTNSYGVYGVSTNSQGVYGSSTNNVGAQGTSTNNVGVQGTSTNSFGVYGTSTNSYGVYGTSTTGTGVYGSSSGSIGVNAVSANYYGIVGSSTNSCAGVFYINGAITASNTANTVLIRRYPSGAFNVSGNVLQITDNPTVSGTKSGALISGQVEATERLRFDPRVIDGSTAVAHFLDTDTALANTSAKLLSIRNAGTEKFSVGIDGSIKIYGTSAGITASGVGDIKLIDGAGNTAFRSTRANAWSDSQGAQFFQVGNSNDKAVFTAMSGTPASRMLFTSLVTQISNRDYLTTPAPITGNALEVHTSTGLAVSVQDTGSLTSKQYKLSALNTAPASATDTGTLGEIRVTAGYIYVCVAANTWVRSTLSTW